MSSISQILRLSPDCSLAVALVIVAIAIIYLGMMKAGFGGGVGMVTPLLLSTVMPLKFVLPMMLPLLIACDAASLAPWWRKWDARNVASLAPGAVLGVAAGSGLLSTLPERPLKLGLGILALIFVAIQLSPRKDGAGAYTPRPWHGLIAGGLGGFCSVLAHAAGPIITLYLLPQRLGKERFVATSVIFYTALNWIKVPAYMLTGLMTREVMVATLCLLPVVLLGVVVGLQAHRRFSEKAFANLVYTMVVITALKLVWSG